MSITVGLEEDQDWGLPSPRREALRAMPYIPIEWVLKMDETPYIRTGYHEDDLVLPVYSPRSEWSY